jgi:hypothetical protein
VIDVIHFLVNHEYDAASQRVRAIYERYPGIDPDIAANLVIDDGAFWAAVVGIGVGAVEAIPGIGTAVIAGALLPEVAYVAKLQVDVILQLALIKFQYGFTGFKEANNTMDVAGQFLVGCNIGYANSAE